MTLREEDAARARELPREEVARRLSILSRLWRRWGRPLPADRLEAVFAQTLAVPLLELERACWVVLERKAEPGPSLRETLLQACALVSELRARAIRAASAAQSGQ